jgi:hypothetical protein
MNGRSSSGVATWLKVAILGTVIADLAFTLWIAKFQLTQLGAQTGATWAIVNFVVIFTIAGLSLMLGKAQARPTARSQAPAQTSPPPG